ncbi:MAG: hypothetical protein ABSH48_12505, partial [Verrucomicrobiota bacterium]
MRTHRLVFGLTAVGCLTGVALPPRAVGEVSDADFNALKEMVQKLSDQVQSLQQTNLLQEQAHQLDMDQIRQLQEKLSETRPMVTNTVERVMEAAETQPIPREPIDEATVNHNFMIAGDAEFQYVKSSHENGAFLLADFAPIFLYRAGDNIMFEAGFDTTIQNGGTAPVNSGYGTTFNLSFAQLDYVMNDYMTLCAGELLLPLGTYQERGAGWLNKIPDDPLAVDELLPGSGVGAELRGAIPLGENGKFINYSVYGVNGPSSSDGTGNAEALDLGGNVGLRSDGVVANLHSDPSGGSRLAVFLPLAYKPRYDLELGISGQTGEWDNGGTHLWSAGVLDAALHLGQNFEAKGEYILTRFGSDDLGLVNQDGWFVQASYKLAGLNLEVPLLNDVELVARYDYVHDGLG